MKVEGSHRSSLMLLWNSFAADFAFHFFLGSIYQYREERNTGKIGKEVICSSKETGTQRAATSCAPCSQAPRGARPLAHFAPRVRCAKRLVAANRWVPFLCTEGNSWILSFARFWFIVAVERFLL